MNSKATHIENHMQICSLCEAMCGLNIETRDGEILSIKGNQDDTFSKGYLCAKAMALKDIHEDQNRLRQPIKRTATGWQEISWPTALQEIAQTLQGIQKKHGRDSIGLYMGNPRYHHHGSLLSSILLKKSLNSRNCYSVASSDQLPHMLAAQQLFGHMAMLPVPDLDRTDFLLCFGANPLVSNGSMMGTPFIKKRLKDLQNRGGKLVTVDPRKTETSALADQHIFIQPGQDTYLLLAMIHFIFNQNLIHQGEGEWQHYTQGLAELAQLVQPFSPSRAAQKTGIEQSTIETLAEQFVTAKRAVAYGRIGICTQKNGSLNAWLIYVLNIITGNLDQPGGLMFPTPAADLALLSAFINEDGRFNEFQSPIHQLPSFDSELPVIEMADRMLSDDANSIRALINIAGNPALSTPDGKKLSAALGQLDYMVAVDFYINDSNRHANIILPPTSPLERSQYNLTCNLTAIRNNARYSSPLFPPAQNAKHDWEILLILSNILNRGYSLRSVILRIISVAFQKVGADAVLDLLLRLGPYGFTFRKNSRPNARTHHFKNKAFSVIPEKFRKPCQLLFQISPFSKRPQQRNVIQETACQPLPLSLNQLKKTPHGIDLGPMTKSLPNRLFTKDKTINLVPEIYKSALIKLDAPSETANDQIQSLEINEFTLIGRRTPRAMNSWLNNFHRFSKGKSANTLLMHPDDARTLKLITGNTVRIEAEQEQKSIFATIEISASIMKGVICLPHGWSKINHQALDSSYNDLTSSQDFDPVSGMSVLNNITVKIYSAEALS